MLKLTKHQTPNTNYIKNYWSKFLILSTFFFLSGQINAQIKVWNNNRVTTGWANQAPEEQLNIRGDFFVLPDRPEFTPPPNSGIYHYGGVSNSGFWFTNHRYNNGATNEPMICPQWGMTMWIGNNDNWIYRVYSGQFWNLNGQIGVSDRRLKKNISIWSESALEKIMRLNIYRYDMDVTKFNNIPEYKREKIEEESKNKIGFMAQELQVEFPEVVEKNGETDYLGVNYSMMVPVLLQAIKEQQKLIQEMQEKIAGLESILDTK